MILLHEIKIKNKEGVVVINRIHTDKCVQKQYCIGVNNQGIGQNDCSGVFLEESFLSSLVSDKKDGGKNA